MNTFIRRMTRPYALACVTAALAVSGSALAASPSSPLTPAPSITVRYDDLNLASDRGTAVLYQRIARAARDVCPDGFSRDLDVVAASRACQAKAIARAVQDVNNPKLALVHEAHLTRG
ncbi:MAG TPA: UrcA family protein [Steroidobacteraceae bacterium]|jgi:UrcA family protein